MISNIPQNLEAYRDRILYFLETYINLISQLKSHKVNLLKFYKNINEAGMNEVIYEAALTIKSMNNMNVDVSVYRMFIPLHLRISFDQFFKKYKNSLEIEKIHYLEVENRIQSLLKSLSIEINEINNDVESDSFEFIGTQSNKCDEELSIQELSIEANHSLNNLEKKVDQLQDMFVEMSSLVNQSAPLVNLIDENVHKSNELVTTGTKMLIISSKLKAAAIPIGSSIAGALIGGPIGIIVGLKAGLVAGVIGGACGMIGGGIIKNHKIKEIERSEYHLSKID